MVALLNAATLESRLYMVTNSDKKLLNGI